MRNFFTFIYLINKFQSDGESALNKLKSATDDSLNEMEFEPSDRSVKNILDFASSYEVLETKETGYVELNLN